MNKLIKALGRELGWIILVCTDRMIRFLPEGFVLLFLEGLGRLVSVIPGFRRRVALDNLAYVLGRERSGREIRIIFKKFIRGILRNHYEMIKLYHDGNKNIRKLVDIEGKENFDRALEKGRGVIAVSAHMGNFEIVCGRITAEGYRYSAMAASARDERARRYFSKIWMSQGMEIIPSLPVVTAMRRSIETLKANRILGIYADQNCAIGGVFVDFFGRSAATATSPAALAIKTGAAIVPVFTVRAGRNKHRIIIEKPLEIDLAGEKHDSIMKITESINRIIEKYIREYPEQWWWFHDRWKRKKKNTDKVG